jgi:hypothetical protein
MNEPPRLLDQDGDALKSLILRSSELDVPSARIMRRVHALALGVASSTVATVGAASTGGGVAAGTMLGSVSTIKAIAIWVSVGLVSGALVSGTAATLMDARGQREAVAPPAQTAEVPRAAAPIRPDLRASGATTPKPDTATVNGPSAVAAYENRNTAPPERAMVDRLAAAPPAAVAAVAPAAPIRTTTTTPQGAARFEPTETAPQAVKPSATPNDELAQELASVDQARSALRSGNAAAALEQVSRYERTYKRPRFAPEASALRIEALIAQGRRAEAAQLARVFMANHPGHPLTVRLRTFLGEAP